MITILKTNCMLGSYIVIKEIIAYITIKGYNFI